MLCILNTYTFSLLYSFPLWKSNSHGLWLADIIFSLYDHNGEVPLLLTRPRTVDALQTQKKNTIPAFLLLHKELSTCSRLCSGISYRGQMTPHYILIRFNHNQYKTEGILSANAVLSQLLSLFPLLSWPSGRGGSRALGDVWDGCSFQSFGAGYQQWKGQPQARMAEQARIADHGKFTWDGKKGDLAEKYWPKAGNKGKEENDDFLLRHQSFWNYCFPISTPTTEVSIQFSPHCRKWWSSPSHPPVHEAIGALSSSPKEAAGPFPSGPVLVEARDGTRLKGTLRPATALPGPSDCSYGSRADADRHRTLYSS